ncbi:MAG: MaoC family dehydratase N-terminal domain-containing protein [Candidatus Thermoplasmatota archaeon]|jgi:acyl dehydratase|nr:MaoC family dehydratase N-terminal domain-containing protein [Candidatus Thermoplasmatota archaeon]
MVEHSPEINEEMIEKARKLIGVWLRRDVHWPATYEQISLHDIRRWAVYSMGDDNPLFSDVDYGKKTIWGSVIAPPTFPYTIDSTIVGPGFPGVQWIHGGDNWEFYDVIKPGDTIVARARLIDLIEKKGRHVPRFFDQKGEVIYVNQHNHIVARNYPETLRVPRSRSGGGMRGYDAKKEIHKYSREEISEIDREYLNEFRRGSSTLYWEEINVGDQLPSIIKGPLTIVDIVGFYAGRRSVYNVLKIAFEERRRHPDNVYYSPTRGYPVHPAAGHMDPEIASEIGMPGIYDQGWMRVNWFSHCLTNWVGDNGFVTKLSAKNYSPNLVGDLSHVSGTVTGKTVTKGDALVSIDLKIINQRGEEISHATAEVKLPSKDTSTNPWPAIARWE